MKKILHDSSHEDYVPEVKRRAKPRVITLDLSEYWRERDRIIYKKTKDPETIQAIKERYGLK